MFRTRKKLEEELEEWSDAANDPNAQDNATSGEGSTLMSSKTRVRSGTVAQRRRRFENLLFDGMVTALPTPISPKHIPPSRGKSSSGDSAVNHSLKQSASVTSFGRQTFDVQVCHDNYCRVIRTYRASSEGELSLQCGDLVQVVRIWPNEWCEGIILSGVDRCGRFPRYCVEPTDPPATSPSGSSATFSPTQSNTSVVPSPLSGPSALASQKIQSAKPPVPARSRDTLHRPIRPLPALPTLRRSVVTAALALSQQLLAGCLEMKEAAVAYNGKDPKDNALSRWSEESKKLLKDAAELTTSTQALKKKSSENKYGSEENVRKDMRLYLQQKKSLADFSKFTKGLESDVEALVDSCLSLFEKDSTPGAAEIEELDRCFSAVAEAINKLVLLVQSWNLHQKLEYQQQKNLIRAMSYRSLAQSAREMGNQLPTLVRANQKQEFIQIAKDLLNILNSLSESAITTGHGQEGVILKQLSYELLLHTQGDLWVKDAAFEERIQKLKDLLDVSILPHVESLGAFIKTPSDSSEHPSVRDRSSSGSEEEKQDKMRANLLKELIATESAYQAQLSNVLSQLVQPMKKIKWGETLLATDALLSKQFDALDNLATLSKQLLNDLQKQPTDSATPDKQVCRVGDVFCRYIPDLKKHYQSYITRYDMVRERVNELRTSNAEFSNLVQTFCTTHGSDIGFHLIVPIQRLPRYELLLSSLAKATPTSHPDHEELTLALQKIKSLNAFIDETKQKEDNARKIKEILSLLSTPRRKLPKILDERFMKDRIFLREGLLCDITGKKRKEHYVFMFNDFLIKTSPKTLHRHTLTSKLGISSTLWPWENKPAQYVYKDIIPFSRVFLASPLDEQQGADSFNVSFKLIERNPAPDTPPCVQTFTCASEDELRSWMKDISEAINLTQVMHQVHSSSMIVRRK